jgi:hypothetical protein
MEALLITRDDIVRLTFLGGNVDTDKFIQFIKIAQDIHIQGYLGTQLLDRLKQDIIDDTLEDPYLTLLTKYIKPMLIHWGLLEYLPFSAYTLGNKGMYKHSSENAENVDKLEVNYLVEKQRDIAQHYTQRFLDHMCIYGYIYPEYQTNKNDDMHPNKNNYFKGWYL